VSCQKLKILLCGYYGHGNAGDEIVLAGILQGIASSGIPFEARALSVDPVKTAALHGLACYPRFKPVALLKALIWCDVLVLGGGSLIQDATSRRSAAYYIWLMRLALGMKRRVFLWAQGFGPLNDPGLRRLAASAISRASGITLRDPLSLIDLANLGIDINRLILSADPAFLVKTQPKTRDDVTAASSGSLGVSLRQWPSLERSVADVGSGISAFLSNFPLGCVFIPFQLPGDELVSAPVCQQLGSNASILREISTPEQMLNAISRLDVVLGMRLHSLILASMAAVPFVGLSYDPKIDRFCGQAGLPCLTIDRLGAGDVIRLLTEVYDSRESVSESLRRFSAEQTELAKKSVELFNKVM